jgi:hypothetical protein
VCPSATKWKKVQPSNIRTIKADFLKVNYFTRPKFFLGNFAQVKGHKKPLKNLGNDPKRVKMW